jgi:hypothetical protein
MMIYILYKILYICSFNTADLKKLINYIVSFIKEDFDPWIYGLAFVFLIASISFNYTVSFEKKILEHYYRDPMGIVYYFLFYAFAYYIIAVPKLYFEKSGNVLLNKKFWMKSLILMILLSLVAGFGVIDRWTNLFNGFEKFYISKITANLRFLIVFVIPLFIVWKAMDKNTKSFYGFTLKNFDIKPYFIMLLLMVPLIAAASTQPDFMVTYPKFKLWFPQGDIFGLNKLQMTGIYEFTYGLNFVALELFFRGALVIGMVAIMGRNAVLPMAVLYCTLHFGKPMAECISSFFGGYLLGVIALYTRSIFGGCIVHMGIAFLMEIAALLQHYVFLRK